MVQLIMDYQEALAKETKNSGRPSPKVKHPSKMTESRQLAVSLFALKWANRGRTF